MTLTIIDIETIAVIPGIMVIMAADAAVPIIGVIGIAKSLIYKSQNSG